MHHGQISLATHVLGLTAGLANIGYWVFVILFAHRGFRPYIERRFGVTITYGGRGMWDVAGRSRLQNFGIEFLQLAYFLAAFAIWGIALMLFLLVAGGISR